MKRGKKKRNNSIGSVIWIMREPMGSKRQSGIGKESRAAVWSLLRNYPLAGKWKRSSIAEGSAAAMKTTEEAPCFAMKLQGQNLDQSKGKYMKINTS